jgi:glucose-fructose oxidoreductase
MKVITARAGATAHPSNDTGTIRYAVIGLGYIAQDSVLPAFAGLSRSKLTALVSGDPQKLEKWKSTLGLEKTFTYEDLDQCLADPEIDAVYIALPNDLHCDCCIRSARAGKHIICEKPMATSLDDAHDMLHAANQAGVRLMTAYRLHFDPATLKAVELVRSGKIGEPKIFNSTFTYLLEDDENVRLQGQRGGGAIFDLGVYCINAARLMFDSEPTQVFGSLIRGGGPRFDEVEEGASAILRFPNGGVATFTVSFGTVATSRYELIGTKGRIVMDPGYEYNEGLELTTVVGKKTTRTPFRKVDQFGGEIEAFSESILKGDAPNSPPLEGVADLRVIEAIFRSAQVGRPIPMGPFRVGTRPSPEKAKSKRVARKHAKLRVKSPQG